MLFCTSLIVLVGAADEPHSSPRKLQIMNTKVRLELTLNSQKLTFEQRQSMICELLFPSSILAVKLNRKSLVIILETEIYIYDISNMRLLHVIETTPNPEGMSAFVLDTVRSVLNRPSDMCSLTISRQFISCLSLSCPVPLISTRRWEYVLKCCCTHSPESIRRCPPIFHAFVNCCQCNTSA